MAREMYKTNPIKTNPQKHPRIMSTGSALPGAGVDEGAKSIEPGKIQIESIQNLSLGFGIVDLQYWGNSIHVSYKCIRNWKNSKCVQVLSWVWLFVTPWTVAGQAPLSMEFSRQEYWSGLPFPSPGIPLIQRLDWYLLHLLYWQTGSLPLGHLKNVKLIFNWYALKH